MAREKNGATVAIAAAAALAATAPPIHDAGPGIETEACAAPETEHPDCATQIAELTASLDEERRRVVELEAALIEARGELRDQRERFGAAWAEREAQIAALSPERVVPVASPPPAGPRRFRAVGSIRCHLRGAPITIEDGAEIPEGVELSTLPAEAFEEV